LGFHRFADDGDAGQDLFRLADFQPGFIDALRGEFGLKAACLVLMPNWSNTSDDPERADRKRWLDSSSDLLKKLPRSIANAAISLDIPAACCSPNPSPLKKAW
jgi:hypothetical protein